MKENKNNKAAPEPRIIIRPIGRFGGLDGIHISLLIVILLLGALLLVTTSGMKLAARNSTNSSANVMLATHNQSQILGVAERFVAGYMNVNGTLSLLPYISNVSAAKLYYINASKEWLVSIPAKNPQNNQTFVVSMLISDTNTMQITPLEQIAKPAALGNYSVAALGTVKIQNSAACSTENPLQVYLFTDPYAIGGIASLLNATALESRLAGRVNISVYMLDSPATQAVANIHGFANASALSQYLFCAYGRANFTKFASAAGSVLQNGYISPGTLSSLANSTFGAGALSSCLATAADKISNQELFGKFYSINQVPIAVVNCQYLAIPQTLQDAICYANSSVCNS